MADELYGFWANNPDYLVYASILLLALLWIWYDYRKDYQEEDRLARLAEERALSCRHGIRRPKFCPSCAAEFVAEASPAPDGGDPFASSRPSVPTPHGDAPSVRAPEDPLPAPWVQESSYPPPELPHYEPPRFTGFMTPGQFLDRAYADRLKEFP